MTCFRHSHIDNIVIYSLAYLRIHIKTIVYFHQVAIAAVEGHFHPLWLEWSWDVFPSCQRRQQHAYQLDGWLCFRGIGSHAPGTIGRLHAHTGEWVTEGIRKQRWQPGPLVLTLAFVHTCSEYAPTEAYCVEDAQPLGLRHLISSEGSQHLGVF